MITYPWPVAVISREERELDYPETWVSLDSGFLGEIDLRVAGFQYPRPRQNTLVIDLIAKSWCIHDSQDECVCLPLRDLPSTSKNIRHTNRPHAQQALALFQSAGHDTGRARALNAVGWFHAQLGDYQQAIVCCQQALDLQREIDDHFGLAETYDSLGYAHRHLGHQKEATTCYQQAIDLYGELGDRYSEADTLVSLGDAHQAFGDSASARISWQRALTILEQLDHPRALGVRAKIYEDSEYITPARSQVTGWPTRLLQAPHLYRDLGDDIG